MSIEIPKAFENKYLRDFILLSEQQGSRLARTVRTEPDRLDGKAGFFDRIGNVEMAEIIGRHQPTDIQSTPFSRRRVTLRDFSFADLFDWQDALRMSKDPKPGVTTKGMRAAGRQKDRLIINALGGNAYSIDADDAATAVALPTAQKITTGSGGLTILKLRQAKMKLDIAEVDENIPRYCAVTSEQLDNLLATTQVTSSDYNNVKALVEGKVNTYMGFEFVRTQLLKKSSTTRYCYAYAASAIGLATGKEPMVAVRERPDLNMAIQIYIAMSMDCVRIEDVQVVEIACTEA